LDHYIAALQASISLCGQLTVRRFSDSSVDVDQCR